LTISPKKAKAPFAGETFVKTITAAQAKNAFGKFLDMAQREPIAVTKMGRPVGVFFSMADLEDTIWGERALAAHREGYISEAESRSLIDKLRNADD
jgi:prevent-host-death family protein